jgi:lipopolysaccharide/colanic/teichoic acid biosynthesis glycosyltransferase
LKTFGSAAAHNSVSFDGGEPMRRIGRFLYADWPHASADAAVRHADGCASWTASYADHRGMRHKRRVEAGDGRWTIGDDFAGFSQVATLRWHLPPQPFRNIPGGIETDAFRLVVSSSSGAETRIEEAWRAKTYGSKEPTMVLAVDCPVGCKSSTTTITLQQPDGTEPDVTGGGAGKRVFDILLALVIITLLSPVLVGVAALVRVRLGSPVLFRQTRPGLGARPFTHVKFRTMLDAADRNGVPLPDGERLTSFGRRLRATSLDELPEFWNVLAGDMSLVGSSAAADAVPDPLHAGAGETARSPAGPDRMGAVNGRNAIGWDEKLALDVWYVDHRSFWLDLQILWRTVWMVLARRGISAGEHETMPEFLGTSSPDDRRHRRRRPLGCPAAVSFEKFT